MLWLGNRILNTASSSFPLGWRRFLFLEHEAAVRAWCCKLQVEGSSFGVVHEVLAPCLGDLNKVGEV